MKPINVLIVEDSENDAVLLVKRLRDAEYEPQWARVETETDFLTSLHDDLDLIISDFTMPKFDGIRALHLMRSRGLEIPFIIVSGTMGEERAVEALKQGASDYLMKDRTGRLGSAVGQALEKSRLRKKFTAAEYALKEGERKFRTLFDGANDAIHMLQDGIFVDCNAKGQFMYGRSWDEIVGHSPVEFAPPRQPDGRESAEKAAEIVGKALAGEPQFFNWATVHKNGSTVFSEISLNRLEIGGNPMLMAVSRDVTERKVAEEKILEQAALLDQATDAIVVSDLDGNVNFWSKGAERLYGWTCEEAMGRHLGDLIYQSLDAFDDVYRSVLEAGETQTEVFQVNRDKRELTVDGRWTVLRDKKGESKSVLAIHTDVTEKKSMEAQLMRSQRMESIGTLAGGIAHDLNNILTPILTSIEVLKLTHTDPRSKRVLDTIETSSKRGADIVKQVLSFARGIKGKRVEIQPKRLLKDIENLIDDTFPKNICVTTSLPDDGWTVIGDPTLLHQVLLNLSVNARDAMPGGGDLTIKAENITLDNEAAAKYLRAKAGNYVAVSVSDTGTGISSTIRDNIFEPFFTTKEIGKGTGLGLSTVMAIVKSHNGFVDVQSELGKGTTFAVFLPATESSTPKQGRTTSVAHTPRGQGEMILLVDDEASILAVTGDTLESFGYRVLKAKNGVEALVQFQQHQDEIAGVITDMTMPLMDGAETISALLKLNPALKIIASSGYKTGSGSSDAVSGTRHFLAKPYTADALLKALRRVLHEPKRA